MAAVTEQSVLAGTEFYVEEEVEGIKSLRLQLRVPSEYVYDLAAILPVIQERVENEKRPAGVLSKELGRVVLHVDQLNDAVSKLFATYARMVSTVPQKRDRKSNAYKARFALLNGMKDRMLREYGREYFPEEIDDYVLNDPHERETLIHRLCEAVVDD